MGFLAGLATSCRCATRFFASACFYVEQGGCAFGAHAACRSAWPWHAGGALPAIDWGPPSPEHRIKCPSVCGCPQVDKIIGAVRIQQRRVKVPDESCAVPTIYQPYIDTCYPTMTSDNEDYTPYGGSCAARDNVRFGLSQLTPPCNDSFVAVEDGFLGRPIYAIDLPINITREEAMGILNYAQERRYLDLQTRHVREAPCHLSQTPSSPAILLRRSR